MKKKYDLSATGFGNGITIVNRAKEVYGDYQKIAHICPERTITWIVKSLPDHVKDYVISISQQPWKEFKTPANRPNAGDAVVLTKDWYEAKEGSIGIIDGMIGVELAQASITFNYSAYRDDRKVSCSGGPASITTDLSKLKPTGKTIKIKYWKFKMDCRLAGNEMNYYLEVPLWSWDGND